MNTDLELFRLKNDPVYFIENISGTKLHWYQKLILSNLKFRPDIINDNYQNNTDEANYKPNSKQTYTSQFLSMKCCGDVLNIVNPLGNSAEKEISESMGIIQHLRDITLKEPGKYKIYDICAGNALTSIIACHLLPIKGVIAIDKRERNRKWNQCKKFNYIFEDIYNIQPKFFDEDSIIIGIHACKKLAWQIVDLYNKSKAKYLILMPCCEGSLSGHYQYICNKIGKSLTWCLELAIGCNGKIYEDRKILSPKNIIIVAEKR